MGQEPAKSPNPVKAERCGQHGHRNTKGEPCGAFVIRGTAHCKNHAGKTLVKARAEGEVVLEVRRWGLGNANVDAAEILLRLVAQSAARCDLYAEKLADAYNAAERLAEAQESPDGSIGAELEGSAIEDLKRVFNTGGVAALVGNTYAATKDGDIFTTGEAIRGLAMLEAQERDRCVSFAAKAVAAGLAERQVAVEERRVEMVGRALAATFAEMGLTPDQVQEARSGLARHLRLVAS
jgi:hypothetical protein